MGDSNPQLIPPHNKTPTHTHFFYKAIFLSVFLLILPLFSSSSSSPDFIINTTSWELLQLLFVGIVVSYGLFSTKRNVDAETHKDEGTDAQSYVARLFQVSSSLFDNDDDDFEIKTPCASASASSHDDNKSITSSSKVWNSQYYRGEPVVVVANKESSSSTTSVTEKDKKPSVVVGSFRSRVVSKVDRSSSRRKLLLLSPEEKEENIGVLRSPIPWRSRSGRNMEPNPPPASPSISIYQSSNPVVPSPPTRSKSFQDFGSSSRKKITSPPIPPPPPPPPPPLPSNRINRKEFTRNYDLQNSRGTRGGISLSSSSSFRTPNQDEEDNYLSHDQEIESFIETRGGKFIIDEQNFIPNPKQQQQQQDDKKKKEITDTEESSSEDDDDELHELASKSSNGNGNGGEIVGPDVDKKADEFIAKFREQIRLQRIASIRTSTQPQHTSKSQK